MAVRDEAERAEGAHRASRDPLVGTVINGKFHVERAIARGGMGRIYYGTQAPLRRPVALKIVKAHSVNEEESQFLRRFLLEASILAKLQHPNVVTFFDYGRIEGSEVEMYFIAMEYLNGETLTERLRTRGTLAAAETLTVFRQIARGLREAHSRGIVHRDLKPSNILIVPATDGEIVKLVDFGIGKDEGEGEDLTRDGVLVGTPKYMAPEQFDGLASPSSDIYALGVIVYQALTGALPFVGATTSELIMAKLQDPVPSIRKLNPLSDASDTLEALVQQMLARRPDERPTLEDVFNQLVVCEEEVFGASRSRLALSRPRLDFPVSSRPISIGLVAVHGGQQVSAEAPTQIGSDPPRPPNEGALAPMSSAIVPTLAMTGGTPTPAPAPVRTSRSLWLWLGLGLAVLSAIWAVRTHTPPPVTPPASPSAPVASAAPSAAPTSVLLHLDSTPSGAAVSENGNVLGATPITIVIERSSVTDGTPRKFQLKKEGYTTVEFAQGHVDADIRQTVLLSAEPAHTRPSTVIPNKQTAPRPTTSAPESDIRFQR